MNFQTTSRAIAASFALLACSTLTQPAQAQAYPDRAIRWVIPYSPGGGTDVVTRLVAQAAAPNLNNATIVVENKPGGNTVIGTQIVAAAKADGLTIGGVSDQLAANEHLYAKLPYKMTDFEPIAAMTKVPMVVVVRSDNQIGSLNDLIKHLKSNEHTSYGTWGVASTSHLTTERFGDMIGAKFLHVPYPGSAPQIQALLGGQIFFAFADITSALPHIKAGKLKALAVSTKERISSLPDTPAVAETISGFDLYSWNGVVAPKGTPPDIVVKLTESIVAALRDPSVRKQLEERGIQPWGGDGKALASQLQLDLRNSGEIIRNRGIRIE